MPKSKKKGKAGRPRVKGVPRQPNGQISRRPEVIRARELESVREARATVVDARMRLMNVTEEQASTDLAGYELGRLYLRDCFGPKHKAMAKALLEAGNRFAIDASRYYSLSGVPFPSVRSAALGEAGGRSLCEPKVDQVKSAANRWMGLLGCIGNFDREGRPVLTTVMNVCVRDLHTGSWPDHMLKHLIKGLRALVDFYGLDIQDVDRPEKAA